MSETLLPSMNFRWIAPTPASLSQPDVKRLQQMFWTESGEEVWRDVPTVFEIEPKPIGDNELMSGNYHQLKEQHNG